MIDGHTIAAALEVAGFTHVVWIPDSHLGTWDAALTNSKLTIIRPCREGEAVGIAAGLILGGAKPVVAIQCTGFFEAGDAVRNVVHDLKLPLKLIVGVRSWLAHKAGKSADNCPHFAEQLIRAWEVPFTWFDPTATSASPEGAIRELADASGPNAILWAE